MQCEKTLKRLHNENKSNIVSTSEQKRSEENVEDDYNDDDDEILTMENATALLKKLGWSVEIDSVGNHVATLFLPDREIQIFYNDEIHEDFPQFDGGFLVVNGILTAACHLINPVNSQTLPDLELDFDAKGLRICEDKVTKKRLKKELCRSLIRAAEVVDLKEMLLFYYSTPPCKMKAVKKTRYYQGNLGMFKLSDDDETLQPNNENLQENESSNFDLKMEEVFFEHPRDVQNFLSYSLLHLRALALLDDVETLQTYHKSFSQGYRLGFDTSIRKTYLERAIVLAKEVAKEKYLNYAFLDRVAEFLAPNKDKHQLSTLSNQKSRIVQ
ncbi:DUF6990 domain-containing protein [Bartonella rattaustraliani]|uniref:DUF6990 domain-containing protein n=1 Tax=Bartonella rattaustraliani TaxID=481139 RepID=UPI0012EA2AA8|nr:hypothetical protein [Bartonella rattaustraliani]